MTPAEREVIDAIKKDVFFVGDDRGLGEALIYAILNHNQHLQALALWKLIVILEAALDELCASNSFDDTFLGVRGFLKRLADYVTLHGECSGGHMEQERKEWREKVESEVDE